MFWIQLQLSQRLKMLNDAVKSIYIHGAFTYIQFNSVNGCLVQTLRVCVCVGRKEKEENESQRN